MVAARVGGRCLACGARLLRKQYPSGGFESGPRLLARKFCGHVCMGRYAAPNGPAERSVRNAGRTKARRRKDRSRCERCGSTEAVEVHHRDRNPSNVAVENLESLCRKCHKRHHVEIRRPIPCRICGEPQRCRELCNRHYQSECKAGRTPPPLPNSRRGRHSKAGKGRGSPVVPCRICGEPQKCRELCSRHYQSERRAGRAPSPLAGSRRGRYRQTCNGLGLPPVEPPPSRPPAAC